jgi:2,4-didehydro-3-deoxy-L-rhamnonate hydrolase
MAGEPRNTSNVLASTASGGWNCAAVNHLRGVMKLLRYGPLGQEKPGLLDAQGAIRDLSQHVKEITAETMGPAELQRLSRIDPASLPKVAGNVRLGVPVANIRKFIAIGLNYADHAAESNLPLPSEPVIFTKAISCLSGPNDDVVLPANALKGDWEVELGVIMGRTARNVSEAEARDCVAGYCLVNDVSERAFQFERGLTWDKGKGCDTFGPVGPWMVTADEVGDPHALAMWLDLNGARMQTGNTKTMIFGVPALISYVSQFMTLWPGDLITTGTPPGVGMGKKPSPIFLKPGDVMELGIDGLGTQRQHVVAAQRLAAQ